MMMFAIGLVVHWIAVSLVFMIAAQAIKEVEIKNMKAALGAALVYGVANIVIGIALTFVLNVLLFLPRILTLGLVGLLIPIAVNMALLVITDVKVEGLKIRGITALFKMAVATALTGFVVGRIFY